MDRVHAAPPAVGKRLWSYVRAALFMARNGKRKLLLIMHLLGANKRRAVANLLSHHHGRTTAAAYALRRRDYEFSCTNSPAAAASASGRRRLAYFPCLGAVAEEEDYDYGYGYGGTLSLPDASPAPPLARIDYYAASTAASSPAPPSSSSPGDLDDLAPGEELELEEYACASESASASPALLLPGAASGEFSVRVSNYSSEDEAGSDAVDADAEEFIRRFYDQLRRQNTVAMLPYCMQQEAIAAA